MPGMPGAGSIIILKGKFLSAIMHKPRFNKKETLAKIKRNRRALIWGAAVLVAAVVVITLVVGHKEHREEPLPTVEVEKVVPEDVNIYGEYVGRVRAQQFVEVRARVEGYLQKMLFNEGTFVKKGQTLFVIDPAVYAARVSKARAQLNKARAQRQKAERDLNRIRPLYESNAASQLDLDNAVAAYEGANADVIVCEADLTQAELTLGYTNVTSPIAGQISERNADIGTLVGPGAKSLLATIVKSDTVRIDFSMTSLDYMRTKSRNVNLGQRDSNRKWDPYVKITLPDGTLYPDSGLVDFADPKIDPSTGTFSVRAEMPNPDHTLLPGEFTRVKLLMDVREQAIIVPSKAVEVEKGAAFVYIVRPDNIVERRFIETGPEIGNRIIIERGLAAGEMIVVEGYHKLRHGDRVTTVDPSREYKERHDSDNTSDSADKSRTSADTVRPTR